MTEEVKPKKKRVNSKAKGSGFEGHIGKVLAEHLQPLKFRRSQSSGAILGGENARFLEQFSEDAKALFIGDVVPTNEADVARDEGWKFKFTLECKFYRDCDNLEHIFHNTKIKGWMEQAITDSQKIDKKPLLIFKFNRTETYCAIPLKPFDDLCYVLPTTVTRYVQIKFPPDEFSTKNLMKGGLKIVIFMLKDALQDLDWWKVSVNQPSIVEEQPPSGTLCNPEIAKKIFDECIKPTLAEDFFNQEKIDTENAISTISREPSPEVKALYKKIFEYQQNIGNQNERQES